MHVSCYSVCRRIATIFAHNVCCATNHLDLADQGHNVETQNEFKQLRSYVYYRKMTENTTTSTVPSMHMFKGMQLVTGNESTLASGWFDSLAESEGLLQGRSPTSVHSTGPRHGTPVMEVCAHGEEEEEA